MGKFGDGSDVEAGWSGLEPLAVSGDRTAEMQLISALSKTPRSLVGTDQVIEQLLVRVGAGDIKSAEVLLKYFRTVGHARGTLDVRQKLLVLSGIRPKVAVEEGLYLAREVQSRVFWTASEKLVGSAPQNVYARGLAVTAKINRNAYVRILQIELRELEFYQGRINGYLTHRTMRAINRFCAKQGIKRACAYGPVKSIAIKAIASEMAKVRTAYQGA